MSRLARDTHRYKMTTAWSQHEPWRALGREPDAAENGESYSDH